MTHIFGNRTRVRAIAAAVITSGLLVGPVLTPIAQAGPQHSGQHSSKSHSSNHGTPTAKRVPFTTAFVEDTTPGQHRVTWTAPGVQRVKIYVSTDPDRRGTLVATKGSTGSFDLPATDSPDRRFVTLVPNAGVALTVGDRELDLVKTVNFRDLGGYRTANGQWVKTGEVYRTSAPALTAGEQDVIGALGIDTATDLRTEAERAEKPVALPDGVRYQHLDVMGNGGLPDRDLSSEASGEAYMVAINERLVTNERALMSYHTLLTDIAWSDGSNMFNCTAGKDRTGWGAAVLLSLLGVDRDTIMADYLLSNDYYLNSTEIQSMLASLPANRVGAVTAMMSVRPAYLDASFDEVERLYGSVEAYAREGLGLSTSTIKQLRQRLLVGAPQK